MKKYNMLILFLMSFITFYGQDENKIILPVIIPPTPEAAALGKYLVYPVDMCVGVPEIKIPLYTIKSGKLELPITLSYHASGIKVDEIATWVGLGWSLQAGGCISRTILSLPDETDYGFLNSTCLKSPQVFSEYQTRGLNEYGNAKTYFDNLENSYNDSQSDQYQFNANGIAGSFMYDMDKNLVQRPYSDHRISRDSNNNFLIIGDDGTQYKFQAKETSKMEISHLWYTAPITWLLTEIISPDKADTITLHYKSSGNYLEQFRAATVSSGDQCKSPASSYPPFSQNISNVTYSEQVLESIEFRGGKVLFNTSKVLRKDKRNLSLENIKVLNKSGEIIKDFYFDYDYFKSGTIDNKFNFRLKLQAIHEQSGSVKKSHVFGYNLSTLPPYYNSDNLSNAYFGQDHWGYYNGVRTNENLLSVIPPEYPNLTPANRESSDTMKACILNQINYPTGGFTSFTYETNKIASPSGGEKLAGGLRIAKIVSKPSSDGTEMVTSYVYGAKESNKGILMTPISPSIYSYQKYYTCDNLVSPWKPTNGGIRSFCTENPLTPLGYHSGSPVFYDVVTAYQGTKSENAGKTVTEYTFTNNRIFLGTKPNLSQLESKFNGYSDNTSWLRGQVKKQSYFEKDQTVAKKEISYDYTIINERSFYTGKLVNCVWIYNYTTGSLISSNLDARDYYEYIYLLAWTGLVKCTKMTELTRQQSDISSPTISTVTNYAYDAASLANGHYQITKKMVESSNGGSFITKYYYPTEYSDNVSNFNILKSNNMLLPVDERNYKENHSGQLQLISGNQTAYNNMGQPITKYFAELTNTGLIDIGFNRNNPYTFNKRIDYTYNKMDNRLQSASKDDAEKVVYLWSYKGEYPVAEVKNVAYVDVASLLGQALIDRLASAVIPSSSDLEAINNLRNSLPNALITTYTYKPLVGIETMTDPRGVVTKYNYDSFGRLIDIRDHNGNVVESYNYHYQNK